MQLSWSNPPPPGGQQSAVWKMLRNYTRKTSQKSVNNFSKTGKSAKQCHQSSDLFDLLSNSIFSPVLLQGAGAAARREARVSGVAAVKALVALWAEGRNPRPAVVEKVAGPTRAPAAAASLSTRRAAV